MRKRAPSWVDILALPLVVGGTVLLAAGLGRRLYRRTQIFNPSPNPERGWDPTVYGIPAEAWEEHWIETPDGETLYAWYCRAKNPVASALFCHGNRGNLTVSADVVPHLLRANLNVLIFDYRGYGKSSGTPSYEGVLDDSVTAARFHDSLRPKGLPSILYGYSLGGAVAGQVVRRHPFDGLILQSTFTSLTAMARVLHPRAPLHLLAGKLFDTLHSVRKLKIPMLVIHGSADEAVPSSMAQELFDAGQSPKRIHIVEGGLHSDLFTRDPNGVVLAIAKFLAEVPQQTNAYPIEPPSKLDEAVDAALHILRDAIRPARRTTPRKTERDSIPAPMIAVVKSAPLDGPEGTEIRDCPVPKPGPGEVLIRVAGTAICGTDKHIYHWDPSIRGKVQPPRIYGHEFCGFVEELGPGAARDHEGTLAIGDYVSAEMHIICGECSQCRAGDGHICVRTKIYGLDEDGAFAEFVKVPAGNVLKLPSFIPPRVGAFLDALGNAVHTTQVVDLAGKSVAITGFGPIGAMSAAIAEHNGASVVIVTDVSDHALETARRWAASRNFDNLHTFNVRTTDPAAVKKAVEALTGGVGVDVVCEMSGSSAAINFGLEIVRMGGTLSLLGLPAGHSVTIDDYTRNVIFKGVTMHGIIGRRMYSTWQRMLGMLRAGLDVAWIVQATYESLRDFHDGIARFDRHEALKVVFFPEGESAAEARLSRA